jgi:hypothetical protein
MAPESFVFLSDQGLEEMFGDLVVFHEAAIGAVKVADFLSIGIAQNPAVSVVDLGAGRHFHHLPKVIGAGQGVINKGKEEGHHRTQKPDGEACPEGPFPPMGKIAGEKPNQAKGTQEHGDGIKGKASGLFRGGFLVRIFPGLIAWTHGVGDGPILSSREVQGLISAGRFVANLIFFETRGISKVDWFENDDEDGEFHFVSFECGPRACGSDA